MRKKTFYIAALLPLLWGISHLFPTAGVVDGFGNISQDNKLIITMEWIVEGVALVFIGLLIIIVTKNDSASRLAMNVYISIICALFVLAIVSLFTGFKIDFLPFRLCPVIFSASAILLIIGLRLQKKEKPVS